LGFSFKSKKYLALNNDFFSALWGWAEVPAKCEVIADVRSTCSNLRKRDTATPASTAQKLSYCGVTNQSSKMRPKLKLLLFEVDKELLLFLREVFLLFVFWAVRRIIRENKV